MSTSSVPNNLLAPAAVFASLTFLTEVVILICIIIVASTAESNPPTPFVPPSPLPPSPKPSGPGLMRYLKAGEDSITAQAVKGMMASIVIALVMAFLTCCMVFAIHAQRAK